MKSIRGLKRITSIVLCFLLILLMTACQTSPADPVDSADTSTFSPGTYTASVKGHNGDLEVEVTVDESAILDIQIVSHQESPVISDQAIETIPQAIIDGQTLAVDTISGATVTSQAIIGAVTEALRQAGGDIDALSIKEQEDQTAKESVEYTTDVVVIGGGGAGLSAAISAHENGAQVIVLEKMSQVGGNTLISGSAYNAVDPERQIAQGIEDSVEKHFQQTYEGGDMLGNTELIQILVENAYPAVQWLESMGMEFNDTVFTVLGGLWPRAHKPVKPLGTGYIETYMTYIDSHQEDIQVIVNATVTELMVEDGKVVGVRAEGKNEDIIVRAEKGVVLATGGFGANVEMREEYNTVWPSLVDVNTTNHVGATGDGIVMAEAINANLVGMEYIQMLPMGDPETGSLSGNIEQGVENRIFVNKAGERFVDEGERRDVMTKALMEQEDQYMWVIVDQHSYPTGDTKNNFNETIDDLVEQGRAFKADTLEELAVLIGVDPENLVQSVESFNQAVESGGPDELGRSLFADKLDTAPFYAGARTPTVHHTMGGVEINTEAQVIDQDGNVIAGLYAAGEVTGGIHGGNRLGGNALADINVFGRIAGANAALSQ